MAMILTANNSNVSITVEGEEPQTIEGLQSINYKAVQEKEDVAAIGTSERLGVVFGLKVVKGRLSVKSTNVLLNKILSDGMSFQLAASLKTRSGEAQRVTFDECFLEDKDFALDLNGVSVTTYFFNATAVREE